MTSYTLAARTDLQQFEWNVQKCCRRYIKITNCYALELLGFIKVDESTNSEFIDKHIGYCTG